MAEVFKGLLGDTLAGKDASVPVESLCGEGKTVGLYFSAHWCPPCRGFTPKLVEFYKKHHSDKNFEIVFVSSDKKEEEFVEYFGEMPWLALPFADRDRKNCLSKKYKVTGIPTLVLLDGKDGKLITKNGRGKVLEDMAAENFPWRPEGLADILKGVKLVNNKQEEKSVEDLAGKVIAFYFSAHWCPPCKVFTPNLIKFYNKLMEKEKPFEIIFVSSDRTVDSFTDYFNKMPWLTLKQFDDEKGKVLSNHFGVEGIPTLIVVDDKYKIITSNGRAIVSSDPEGESFPWIPLPLSELNEITVNAVNEEACLIYFTDGQEASIQTAKDIIGPVAEHYCEVAEKKNEGPPVHFLYGAADDVSDRLRDFVQVPDDDNLLVILDIPSQMLYVSDAEVLTREAVEEFVTNFTKNKLQGQRLR